MEIVRRGIGGSSWWTNSRHRSGDALIKPPCAIYQGKYLLCFENYQGAEGNIVLMYQKKPDELVNESDIWILPDEYDE